MRRLAALCALLGLALLCGAGPAAAHNVLIGSDPADGARLSSPPEQVSLTFDLPVQPGFSTVTVTGPDGNQWQEGEPVEDGETVSTSVRPLGPAGEYTIGYQVLSADSHPVRGAVRFTLTAPGTGTPAPPPPAGNAASDSGTDSGSDSAAQEESEGAPVWPWLAGAGVLLVAGVVVAMRVSRSS